MSKTRKCCIQVITHAVVWLCLFLYPFFFHHIPFHDAFAILRVSLFLLLLGVFFYTNSLFLIPKLLGRKKMVLYFSSVILFITAIGFASGYIELALKGNNNNPDLFNTARNTGLVVSFLTWALSSLMKITGEWFRNEELRKFSEHERLQSELSFLKMQVNPHFLFNALNNIYSLENKGSPHTGEAILKLSTLIRYMLYEASAELVQLDSEINYLQNYIDLQKLGLDEVAVNFTISGDTEQKKIEPMLLIPLVENAFKHGISYKTKIPVNVSLVVKEMDLLFTVENGFVENPSGKDRTNGIGLINLRRRLEALYPGRHELSTGRQGTKFKAELKLKLRP